jgi:hypothetical protein
MKKLLPLLILSIALFTACGTATPSDPAVTQLNKSYYELAISTNDATKCAQITDVTQKTECVNTINGIKISSDAIAKMDLSLCANIKSADYKKYCEFTINSKNQETQKSAAQIQIAQDATDKNNPKLCEQLAKKEDITTCKYNIIVSQAMQKKDKTLCEGIGDNIFVTKCQKAVADL